MCVCVHARSRAQHQRLECSDTSKLDKAREQSISKENTQAQLTRKKRTRTDNLGLFGLGFNLRHTNQWLLCIYSTSLALILKSRLKEVCATVEYKYFI